jgi:hypothetical protein
MRVVAEGILRGKTVELEAETGLPEGLHVRVIVESEAMPLEERRHRMMALCGVWSQDENLGGIFDAIERERDETMPRTVDL